MSKSVRYEAKMISQVAAYPRLRMKLRLDRARIHELYPPRIVQSLYFDTWHGRALEENLAGVSHREKVRFRWYGPERTGVRGVLERKVRENMLGWKGLLRIDEALAIEGRPRTVFARDVFRHLTAEWNDVRASALLPVQWISYEREYYSAGRVRITIDRKLRTWNQRWRATLSSRFRTQTPDVMIVEAKCAEEHYAELQELLARFPMRVDRCSKFVYASRPRDGAQVSRLPV